MAKNISSLTPEIVRSAVDGMEFHKLIGRWITVQDGGTKTKKIIINVEISLQNNSPVIGFVAVNKKGFKQCSQGAGVIKDNFSKGILLSFSSKENKGYLKSGDGQISNFEIAGNQSETPMSLRDELKKIERYPAGETIDVPAALSNMVFPRMSYNEAIIAGYVLAVRVEDQNWRGSVVLMDANHPTVEASLPMLVGILEYFNVTPVQRPLGNRESETLKRSFDA